MRSTCLGGITGLWSMELVAVGVTARITDCGQLIRSVDPRAGQPSFTAVPEALTISMLLPTVS